MPGSVKVKWRSQPRLSAIHAAYVVATSRRCSDSKTEAALAPAVTEINQRLLSSSLDIATFWQRLILEASSDQDDRVACEIAVRAAGCSELQLDSTAAAVLRWIGECREVMASRFPKLSEQLPLRGRPLIERYEAYGPGLLRGVADFVLEKSPPKDWWPSRFDGLLVQPVLGGDGGYDADGQRFWIEAMLTDADPHVPEVLRIVYLLTAAAIDLHTRGKSGERSMSLPWSLAAVTIVLTAAADLGLVARDPLPIEVACRLWHLGDPTTAHTVARWWVPDTPSRPPLPMALKELDRRLRESQPRSSSRSNPLE